MYCFVQFVHSNCAVSTDFAFIAFIPTVLSEIFILFASFENAVMAHGLHDQLDRIQRFLITLMSPTFPASSSNRTIQLLTPHNFCCIFQFICLFHPFRMVHLYCVLFINWNSPISIIYRFFCISCTFRVSSIFLNYHVSVPCVGFSSFTPILISFSCAFPAETAPWKFRVIEEMNIAQYVCVDGSNLTVLYTSFANSWSINFFRTYLHFRSTESLANQNNKDSKKSSSRLKLMKSNYDTPRCSHTIVPTLTV